MKVVEVVAGEEALETLRELAEEHEARDCRVLRVEGDTLRLCRLLVRDDRLQELLDEVQELLDEGTVERIIVLQVDVSLPQPDEEERKAEEDSSAAREELFEEMEGHSRLGVNYLSLVGLATVVAAIALIIDNTAVLIGAMVIAPLLGPNLALSFGTAVGDRDLVLRSLATLGAGIGVATVLSTAIAWGWPGTVESEAITARTQVGFDDVALALASGAAAALSITSGVSSVLVGVMVAVALLPPVAAVGIGLGQWRLDWAGGAALLLAINIVCVNLAAKLVLLVRGYRPRHFYEKERARKASIHAVVIWVLTLGLLLMLVRLG